MIRYQLCLYGLYSLRSIITDEIAQQLGFKDWYELNTLKYSFTTESEAISVKGRLKALTNKDFQIQKISCTREFCSGCGTKLENAYCSYCKCVHDKDTVAQLDFNNRWDVDGHWSTKNCYKDEEKDNDMHTIHACVNCKYFIYHWLAYCPLCGAKFETLRLTQGKIKETMHDYKTGWM